MVERCNLADKISENYIIFTINAIFIKFLNDIFDRFDFADAHRSLISGLLLAVLAQFKAEAMPIVYRTCRWPFDPSGPLVGVVVVLMLGLVGVCSAGEMTFELPDNEKQCFYEHIEKDVSCVLEYQVLIFKKELLIQDNSVIGLLWRHILMYRSMAMCRFEDVGRMVGDK